MKLSIEEKHVYLGLIITLLLSGFSLLPLAKTQEVNSRDITFQPNNIPSVNVYYDDYSFVFEYKSYFIRVRPFVIYDGAFYGMKRIVQWIKNNYENVSYKWLVDKAVNAIHYGFNLTRLPQNVTDKIDYLGFRLVDCNFNIKKHIELEEVEFLVEGYNVTRIHIPKANLVFSFEDLYPYGYSIEHINSTYILIGNVKNRTDLYVDPIVFSSSIITVIGGTEGSELDVEDIYDADKAGTYQLLSPSNISSPTDKNETRYMIDYYQTVNGLLAWELGFTQQPPHYWNFTDGNATLLNGRWGMRVWKRHINETETELTSGTPVAQVNRSSASESLQSAIWNCPEISLEITDSIVVRLYLNISGLLDWSPMDAFTTFRLSGVELLESAWNVSYYTYILFTGGVYQYRYYFGSSTYNSTIQNFAWTHVNSSSLDNDPRPADDKALKLNVTITNLSTSGNVTINGEDKDSGEQTETIDVIANTTYITSLWWKNVSIWGVVCYGDYTIEISQLRWGVVWKTGDAQFMFDARIVFGNGTVAGTTWFADSGVQVVFNDILTANFQNFMERTAYANVRFGVLEDATEKSTSGGVHFVILQDSYQIYIIFDASSTGSTNLYSCSFTSIAIAFLSVRNGKIYNNILSNKVAIYAKSDTDYFNVNIQNSDRAIYYPTGTWDTVFVTESAVASLFIRYAGTLRNLYARGCARIAWMSTLSDIDFYLVNADSDTWVFFWGDSTATVYRQYEFDLTMTYDNYTMMEDANVTISNSITGYWDSWLTYSNGSIPPQTYSYGHYNQTDADSLYDYNPYNITVTKSGLQTYTALFNVTEKTELTIALQETTAAVTYTSAILIVAAFILIPIGLIIWWVKWK